MLIKCLQEPISEAGHYPTPSLEDKSIILDGITQGYRCPALQVTPVISCAGSYCASGVLGKPLPAGRASAGLHSTKGNCAPTLGHGSEGEQPPSGTDQHNPSVKAHKVQLPQVRK